MTKWTDDEPLVKKNSYCNFYIFSFHIFNSRNELWWFKIEIKPVVQLDLARYIYILLKFITSWFLFLLLINFCYIHFFSHDNLDNNHFIRYCIMSNHQWKAVSFRYEKFPGKPRTIFLFAVYPYLLSITMNSSLSCKFQNIPTFYIMEKFRVCVFLGISLN